MPPSTTHALASEGYARAADASDPLGSFRDEFHLPRHEGQEMAYFVGNSLGLQPKSTANLVNDELRRWAELGVEGHFRGTRPWMDYHAQARDDLALVVGAEPGEIVVMNSLTVNLHLMMASFYRPVEGRAAILIEAGAFPSDRHAVESQIRLHGFDPATELIELQADEQDGLISDALIEETLDRQGSRIALVLWPGVQYRTGQAFDLAAIASRALTLGCRVGFDLAHAVGNIPLALHDSGADFAVWCHYKYLNSGPGAVGGAFVHARHAQSALPRMAGWWGHDPATRFQMGPDFSPTPGADGWQLSNPPVLAVAPLLASLDIFRRATLTALREKSVALTGYLERLINTELNDLLQIVTPAAPDRRGCQLSLRVRGGREQGRALFAYLESKGILGDWREPDVIRISPAPLYNSYADVLRFVIACRDYGHQR